MNIRVELLERKINQGGHKAYLKTLKKQKVQFLEGYSQVLEEELMTVKRFLEINSLQAMWVWRFRLQR